MVRCATFRKTVGAASRRERKRVRVTVSRPVVGVALVLLAASVFSATSVSAVLSYQGGANPNSVIAIRFIGSIIVLYGLLRLSGAKIALSRRDRTIALLLGSVQAAQSYFLYTSFDHIPVALTMIIFYVYPLLVGLFASAIGQEKLTWGLGAGLVIAFIGLTFVFNVTGDGLNFAGALFAALAAVMWTIIVVMSAHLMRGGDSRPVTLHIQLSAATIFWVILLISGDAVLPATTTGWTAFLLLPLFYGISISAFFAANAMIGSVKTSLFMNSEPVFTIILGWLILAQTLTPLQLLGATFVIAGLLAARWSSRRVSDRR